MNLHHEHTRALTRREFLTRTGRFSLGSIALGSLFGQKLFATSGDALLNPLSVKAPPLPGKAKAVIYLSMSGAPPQQDLFDFKPKLNELNMQPCPAEFLQGRRSPSSKARRKSSARPTNSPATATATRGSARCFRISPRS